MVLEHNKITIENAQELHKELLWAIEAQELTTLDMQKIAELDMAGIQLLSAAQRYAQKQGRKLVFTNFIDEIEQDLKLLELEELKDGR